MKKSAVFIIILICQLVSSAQVYVSLPDTTALNGQSINVPVYVGSLTGKNVISYQFKIKFSSNVLSAIGIETAGTLSSTTGWSALANANTPGEIIVGAFGSSELSGGGKLVYLKFNVLGNGTSQINFENFTFNAGTPSVTLKNGSFNNLINESLTLTCPNGGENWMAGTTQNITWAANGITNIKIEYSSDNGMHWNIEKASHPAGSGNYSWVVPNTSSEQCKIKISEAVDNNPFDVSDNSFKINIPVSEKVNVSLPDTTGINGSSINIPVYVGDLTGKNIISYQFKIIFNSSVLSAAGIETTGTLSNSLAWSVLANTNTPGEIIVGAFGPGELNGYGKLLYLKFNIVGYGTSQINFENFTFNAGNPDVNLTNGSINTIAQLKITISSSLKSGVINQQYSEQLTADGGVTPYFWSKSSGTLPEGLSLTETGLLSGTPKNNGEFSFLIKVTDALNSSIEKEFHLEIKDVLQNNYSFDSNLDNWQLWGDPLPQWLGSIYGRNGIFDNNGDSWCSSGAYSTTLVGDANGFSLTADIYLDVTNQAGCWLGSMIGLTEDINPNWSGDCSDVGYGLYLAFDFSGDACWADSVQYQRHAWFGMSLLAEDETLNYPEWGRASFLNADSYLNSWHKLKIQIGSDSYVKFYIDNSLIWVSTKKIHPKLLTGRNIIVGGRSSGSAGKAYVDNVNSALTNINTENKIFGNYFISQNYPNPFNPSTIINYTMPQSGHASLKIFDLLGKEIAVLVDEYKAKGNYSVVFDAGSLASGLYIYNFKVNDYSAVKKMIIAK